ncbi:uncharacterized protein LOC112081919 [Eutrema salsugineum]|uniref:uncharacterized protein LOC112081919 n=1 Tax=Eutrema salsugineum TaxID=72664 RepID=UPI000CED3834|nr:uncharacterized protein LOC112081919 [Eutrema salsugineum]
MECNRDEAKRALDIAEKKLSDNDYVGAKKFVSKAQNLYPQLDGLKQVLVMVDVYISAASKINGSVGEADWYGVLGVDPLADDEALKRQYKKLALLLHPDKNMCKGAEGAFKLVLEAWCLLSDKVKRTAYDQKRKRAKAGSNPPPQVNSSKCSTFWTLCNICKTQGEYPRGFYLNKAIRCQNCGQTSISTDIHPWESYVKKANFTPHPSFVRPGNLSSSSPQQQQQQWSAKSQSTNKNTNGASSFGVTASYNRGNAENQELERLKTQNVSKFCEASQTFTIFASTIVVLINLYHLVLFTGIVQCQ